MKRKIAVLFLCFALATGTANAAFVPVWGHHLAHGLFIHGAHHGLHYAMLGGGAKIAGGALATRTAFQIGFGLIAAACIWHIPAWEQAKANHTEAAYQAQQMWPQGLFARLPHGNYAYVDPKNVTPSGGHLRASLLAMQK